MPTVTTVPTAQTFSTAISPTSYSTSATPGTAVALDLRGKEGAWVLVRIGRNAATALTRSAYVSIRRTDDDTIIHPDNSYDCISSTVAVNATTVSSGGAAGATTVVLASGTGFAAGQQVCLQLSGARCEFVQITDLNSATITIDRTAGFRVSHDASDVVTNGADIFTRWVPGGDQWTITPVNNSGQTVVMSVEVQVANGYTGTY
jgi:hypothetical protein